MISSVKQEHQFHIINIILQNFKFNRVVAIKQKNIFILSLLRLAIFLNNHSITGGIV